MCSIISLGWVTNEYNNNNSLELHRIVIFIQNKKKSINDYNNNIRELKNFMR